jgi:hypothetical protein
MKRIFLLLAITLLLTSCVTHKHETYNPDYYIVYGFWSGLWHGFIAPLTFVISLFSDNVTVWETHNNGGWYTFGFLLGIGGFSGTSVKVSKRS